METESGFEDSTEASAPPHRAADDGADGATTELRRPHPVVVEADEIVFKAGAATLSLSSRDGGTLEIRAPHVRILGENVLSEAEQTNSVVGRNVVTEAELAADVLGKLIRINGQCVKINC